MKTYKVERNYNHVVIVYGEYDNYKDALTAMQELGGAPYYVKKYIA